MNSDQKRFDVGILGATGAVGQKFIELLDGHPWFSVTAVAASERSAGRKYGKVARWIGNDGIPESVARLEILPCTADLDCDFVFSGLDASVAGDIEQEFAKAGYPVISNARNHRMLDEVPLLIPEVNPHHISLIDRQRAKGKGFIVTNPNCSTVGLVSALKPLHDAFGVEKVVVSTMQALSGAGYPGVASLDIVGNVLPYISGEEEKVSAEPRKLLGRLVNGSVEYAGFAISAHCNRVPVRDGHTECVSVSLAGRPGPADAEAAMASFQSEIDELDLPTAPRPFLRVLGGVDDPQPRRHVEQADGMAVWIGRVRRCDVLGIKFVVLVHNTVRGAAGGAILNAELLVEKGYISAS